MAEGCFVVAVSPHILPCRKGFTRLFRLVVSSFGVLVGYGHVLQNRAYFCCGCQTGVPLFASREIRQDNALVVVPTMDDGKTAGVVGSVHDIWTRSRSRPCVGLR